MEYGRLTGAKEGTTTATKKNLAVATSSLNNTYNACMNMGNQFRPLKEVDKYGRANPFQDPARGVIPLISAGVAIIPAITANTKSRNLLINLSGKDSIVGRGIQVYNATYSTLGGTTRLRTQTIGCCTIGLDKPPTVSVNHHHHYGYGGYSGYAPAHSTGYSGSSHGHGHSSSSHGHGYTAPKPSGYSSHGHSSHGYTQPATAATTHKHEYGHGNGIGSHSHGASGYAGYSTGTHTHGSTSHSHEVGAGGAHGHGSGYTAKPKSSSHSHGGDFFGGKNFSFSPRRSAYGY